MTPLDCPWLGNVKHKAKTKSDYLPITQSHWGQAGGLLGYEIWDF